MEVSSLQWGALSLCRLAESLAHSLQVDLLSSRTAVNDRLHPLFTSVSIAKESLQNAHTHMRDASQHNEQTLTLLDAANTLVQQYQVNTS